MGAGAGTEVGSSDFVMETSFGGCPLTEATSAQTLQSAPDGLALNETTLPIELQTTSLPSNKM